ncbi:hypothetical protein ACIQTZ_12135 [Paenarthrobacter sp. NPDC090520]|uniref:hypothetical protein n=1 Tax=Paenarthrobacter sp. NPDC090520 TaxID=3364382 RepID=UPI003815356E
MLLDVAYIEQVTDSPRDLTRPSARDHASSRAGSISEIDEGVWRWHDHAVSTGEERILARTIDGDLYSYRRDEITLTGKYVPVVAPLWFMTTFAAMIVGLALVTLITSIVSSVSDGVWARMILPVVVGLFAWLLLFWARRDWDARARRRERGIPEPKEDKKPVQIDLHWPPTRTRNRRRGWQ